MTDAKLPTAVASGIDAPDAVSPRRVAIVVGVLTAAFIVALLGVVGVPTRVLGWLGGPATELARYGGLHVTLRDAPYVIEVPSVDEMRARYVARVMEEGGVSFHEVIESQTMVELTKLDLGIVMAGRGVPRSEPWVDSDTWREEDNPGAE